MLDKKIDEYIDRDIHIYRCFLGFFTSVTFLHTSVSKRKVRYMNTKKEKRKS